MVMQGWNKVLPKNSLSEAPKSTGGSCSKRASIGASGKRCAVCRAQQRFHSVLCMMDRSSEAEDMLMDRFNGAFSVRCAPHIRFSLNARPTALLKTMYTLKRSRGDARLNVAYPVIRRSLPLLYSADRSIFGALHGCARRIHRMHKTYYTRTNEEGTPGQTQPSQQPPPCLPLKAYMNLKSF
jgi:hypothetical protein